MVRRSRDCYYGWVEGRMSGWTWEWVGGAAAARPGSDDDYFQCHLSWFCDNYQWHLMIAKIPAVIVG